ncbi:hypothetical protein DN069_13760 [Streptacidiphilus pinicola]|uniref:Uncharacterized protein n=1 Tax=Streptacidiphilus pinicola TaxID=2219663 RepID=A0A2X0IP61_9ACTN|nr:hypothetical protein DN069_13760 [Streptacidiphilus pinicola]
MLLALTAATSPQASPTPAAPGADTITVTTTTAQAFTGWFGVTPEKLSTVADWPKNVHGPAQHDQWTALEVESSRSDADIDSIDYSTDAAGYQTPHAGDVLQLGFTPTTSTPREIDVTYPGGSTGLDAVAAQLEKQFHIPSTTPLMDGLAAQGTFVVRLTETVGDQVIHTRTLLPWPSAGQTMTQATVVEQFPSSDQAPVARISATRAGAGSAGIGSALQAQIDTYNEQCQQFGGPLCKVNWKDAYDRSMNIAQDIDGSAEFRATAPARPAAGKAMPEADVTRLVSTSEDFLEKSTKTSGVKKALKAINNQKMISWGSLLSNALANSHTWSDKNATNLDKAYAVVGGVPVLGEVIGIASGIDKQDAESIAVNTLSLVGIVAATVCPPLGATVEFVMIGYTAIKLMLSWFTVETIPTPSGSALPDDYVSSAGGVIVRWATTRDERRTVLDPGGTTTNAITAFDTDDARHTLFSNLRADTGAYKLVKMTAYENVHNGRKLADFTCEPDSITPGRVFCGRPTSQVLMGSGSKGVRLELQYKAQPGACYQSGCTTKEQKFTAVTHNAGSANLDDHELTLQVTG